MLLKKQSQATLSSSDPTGVFHAQDGEHSASQITLVKHPLRRVERRLKGRLFTLLRVEGRDAKLNRDSVWDTQRHRKSVRQSTHFDSSHGSDCECAASDADDPGKIVRG
jgi:hypothetical protein